MDQRANHPLSPPGERAVAQYERVLCEQEDLTVVSMRHNLSDMLPACPECPRRGDDPDKKRIYSMNRHIPLRLSSWMHLVALSLLLGLGVLTCSLLTPRTAHAKPLDTFTITDCTDESQLRSAISNASSGETITFDCNGTIPITVANGPLTIATNLTLDGSGQSVTLDGQSQV